MANGYLSSCNHFYFFLWRISYTYTNTRISDEFRFFFFVCLILQFRSSTFDGNATGFKALRLAMPFEFPRPLHFINSSYSFFMVVSPFHRNDTRWLFCIYVLILAGSYFEALLFRRHFLLSFREIRQWFFIRSRNLANNDFFYLL